MAEPRGNHHSSRGVIEASIARVNGAQRIRWTDDILARIHAQPGLTYRQLKVWALAHWHRDFQNLSEQALNRKQAEAEQLLSSLWLQDGILPLTPSGFSRRVLIGVAALAVVLGLVFGGVLGTIDARNDVQACDFDRITTCVPWLQEDFR
jgi:hypothetical protein